VRTAAARLHVPDHSSGWWVGHTAAAVAGMVAVVYLAAVLLVVAARLLV
jgi:hypothetical protein